MVEQCLKEERSQTSTPLEGVNCDGCWVVEHGIKLANQNIDIEQVINYLRSNYCHEGFYPTHNVELDENKRVIKVTLDGREVSRFSG